MSERVSIENLIPGMVITRVTQQNGPVPIQKSGLVSSAAMVQGLAEMGVQEVEIDPDLTVELAPKVSHQTQTQALLRGQHDTAAKSVASMDNALSDQFNRSLFLPTVQSLPSVWHGYTKAAVMFLFVILIGLGIGFGAGSAQHWWPALVAGFKTPEPSSENEVIAKNNIVPPKNKIDKPQSKVDEPQEDVASAAVTSEPAKRDTPDVDVQNTPVEEVVQTAPLPEVETVKEPPAEPITKSAPAYEGKVLNEPTKSNVDVSPELMAKFNEAVKALDTEKETQTEAPKSNVNVHSEVPRVDQLPVRLLTRLPSMSFSAHMYASNPNDRWVRVNGMQLGEGDWINDRVQIVNIEGQRVILSFENELFSMAALTDW